MQGRLAALSSTPVEGQPIVRRGHVARIQNSADFFVALEDHVEWGHAFTVWGEVRMIHKAPSWFLGVQLTEPGLLRRARYVPGCATHSARAAAPPNRCTQ